MESTCEICQYFRRHFLKERKGYKQMSVGHCQYPRIKIRYEEEEACKFFEPVKREKI